MLAAIASESLPYTDPHANYPAALAYRAARAPDPTLVKEAAMTSSRRSQRAAETSADQPGAADVSPDPAVQAIRAALARPATGEPSPYDPRKPRLAAARRAEARAARDVAADEF